jgi:transposase
VTSAPAVGIEIVVGMVTIRLDGATSAVRLAEIVQAIGSRP